MSSSVDTIRDLAAQDYKWGFVTEIDEDRVPKGLNEDIVRLISARKGEPEFMLEWRLNALRHWFQMEREEGEPKWANVTYCPHRLPGHRVLLGAKAEAACSTASTRSTQSCCSTYAKARHSAR